VRRLVRQVVEPRVARAAQQQRRGQPLPLRQRRLLRRSLGERLPTAQVHRAPLLEHQAQLLLLQLDRREAAQHLRRVPPRLGAQLGAARERRLHSVA
jgi:hypothetical protein